MSTFPRCSVFNSFQSEEKGIPSLHQTYSSIFELVLLFQSNSTTNKISLTGEKIKLQNKVAVPIQHRSNHIDTIYQLISQCILPSNVWARFLIFVNSDWIFSLHLIEILWNEQKKMTLSSINRNPRAHRSRCCQCVPAGRPNNSFSDLGYSYSYQRGQSANILLLW